jgi:hypothetical protein
MRVGRWVGIAMACAAMVAPAAAEHLSDTDLHRYGFGEKMVHTLRDSQVHEPPRSVAREAAIPPPIVGSAPLSDRDIPEPSLGPTRLIPQGERGVAPPYEGPTRLYQGSDGKELEGTFKEVENFFFRPGRHYDRFLSQSERDVTGLVQMFTGEIDRKGSTHGRFGVQHTLFRKSFGEGLLRDRRLEQVLFPVVAMVVPGKDLEIAQSLTVIDEEARNFPLIRDHAVTGLRDATTTVKYRFLDNPEDRVSMAGLFAIKVGIENVVTRVGSNGVDFLMGMALTKRIHNMGLHLDGGYIFANGQDRTNNRAPDVGFADFGIDFQTGPTLNWTLEFNYTDFDFIGHRFEITPGLKWKFADRWRFDVGFPLTADDTMAQGYYYRLSTGFQVRF